MTGFAGGMEEWRDSEDPEQQKRSWDSKLAGQKGNATKEALAQLKRAQEAGPTTVAAPSSQHPGIVLEVVRVF
jgi:hypothetical protein